jgi:ATP-binding cassette subfamily F protein 3
MSLLTAHNLSKVYGPDEIFSGVSIEIPHAARIAVVGPNGAGKTTLLNILRGHDTPDSGTVQRARGLRIGFLPQRPELHGQHTLIEEQLAAFAHIRAMEADMASLERALANPAEHDAALAAYSELQDRFERAGGYVYEQRIRTVMHGLGFSPHDFERPLSKLSGGQKTRALLGRLLLESPDLLLLDEPTNHLDIQAVEWLEGCLSEFPGAVLMVSHDRYFIDSVATTIWELDFGSLEVYHGNFSHYAHQRVERHDRLIKEYEAQQDFITKQEDYIRRNMAGQNTRQAKGRLRRLERLKRDELLLRPRTRDRMSLRLGAIQRSGDKVLSTRDLAVGYPDSQTPLFQVPDMVLRRGDVAALIGPNGVGKTTFIKTVVGQIQPLAGEAKIGASVTIGYFAQAQEALNEDRSILDEILTAKPMLVAEARTYLGRFLFHGDDVFRTISSLSGGERGRVALAKLALTGANFLLLDEPTNHLDIESQEVLQTILADFAGTILLVSHDRYLIDALATQIWVLTPGVMQVFEGTYRQYQEARARTLAAERAAAAPRTGAGGTSGSMTGSGKKHGLNAYQLQKRMLELEDEIEMMEAQLVELAAAIEQASSLGKAEQVRSLGEIYVRTEAERDAAMTLWGELVD